MAFPRSLLWLIAKIPDSVSFRSQGSSDSVRNYLDVTDPSYCPVFPLAKSRTHRVTLLVGTIRISWWYTTCKGMYSARWSANVARELDTHPQLQPQLHLSISQQPSDSITLAGYYITIYLSMSCHSLTRPPHRYTSRASTYILIRLGYPSIGDWTHTQSSNTYHLGRY